MTSAIFRERDGKFEANLPFLPQLKWTIMGEDEIGKWVQSKEDEKMALEQEWVDALNTLSEAVKKPLQDFAEAAETLKTKEKLNELNTTSEVISWIADNTFVDGTSLRDINPDIDELLANLNHEAESLEDRFFLRAISATPRTIRGEAEFYDSYWCDGPQCCSYDGMSCWYDYGRDDDDFEDKVEDAIEWVVKQV